MTTPTPPPQQRLETDVKAAMKAGDKERLSTLRMLLSAVKNERIARGSEVDEAGFAALTRKAIKQREEAAEQYRKGGRPELAEKEEREGKLLAAYLPAQVDEAQLRTAIQALVAERGVAGNAGNAAMGPIMKEMMARFGATADGATISRLAREILAGK
ncbi:MAG TPA: GatB/YqeY domain-containing protein [Thermoanaerobaculia bacterium]|nr:GatB/YqeY domain-containing protein [Thermoanaerobaculia bacterium]